MSISTLRRRLWTRYYRIEKVRGCENLYRVVNAFYNLYVGGYDRYFTFEELVEIANSFDGE